MSRSRLDRMEIGRATTHGISQRPAPQTRHPQGLSVPAHLRVRSFGRLTPSFRWRIRSCAWPDWVQRNCTAQLDASEMRYGPPAPLEDERAMPQSLVARLPFAITATSWRP